MEFESNKLFVGGITQSTNATNLREYFSKYGEVKNAKVMRNWDTGGSRGFGFVSFTDHSSMERALQNEEHQILGERVAVNIPRPIEKKPLREVINKIFVGGLPPGLSKEEFDSYFETFGRIIDSVIMCNKQNNTPLGFGFVTYDSEESVQKVMIDRFHQLKNKWVEVKRAIPRGEAQMKVYGHNYYQRLWDYGPSSCGYYQLPNPSTDGYYTYDAYAYQTGAPYTQHHGQQLLVNAPNLALYPSSCYNMPFGQRGNFYVNPTYMDHRVNGNGRRKDHVSSSGSNDITESVTIQEAEEVENGVPGKPNDEISRVIVHADGVVKSISTCSSCESPKIIENEVSETPIDEISDVIAHTYGVTEATQNCSSCEIPMVGESGACGTAKDERSNVIAHADGVTEAAPNCSLCESPKIVEDGISGAPRSEITKVIVHENDVLKGHSSEDFVSTCVPSSAHILCTGSEQEGCLV